jgi:hypothetical protein
VQRCTRETTKRAKGNNSTPGCKPAASAQQEQRALSHCLYSPRSSDALGPRDFGDVITDKDEATYLVFRSASEIVFMGDPSQCFMP